MYLDMLSLNIQLLRSLTSVQKNPTKIKASTISTFSRLEDGRTVVFPSGWKAIDLKYPEIWLCVSITVLHFYFAVKTYRGAQMASENCVPDL